MSKWIATAKDGQKGTKKKDKKAERGQEAARSGWTRPQVAVTPSHFVVACLGRSPTTRKKMETGPSVEVGDDVLGESLGRAHLIDTKHLADGGNENPEMVSPAFSTSEYPFLI